MYVRTAGWLFSLCSIKSHQRQVSRTRRPVVVAFDPGLHELTGLRWERDGLANFNIFSCFVRYIDKHQGKR